MNVFSSRIVTQLLLSCQYREGQTSEDFEAALPLDNGGFVGMAWNKPFGRDDQQIGAALMYGEPSSFRESQGFENQYGIESYWKVDLRDWLQVTVDIQMINNIDKDLEVVPGLRIKVHKTF